MSWQQIALRAEGLTVLAASVWMFERLDGGWGMFAIFILAPDLSALGYLLGRRIGAAAYNTAHAYVWPIGLAVIGLVVDWPVAVTAALIWSAHIGVDRAVGYGFKYLSEVKKDTHITRA